MPYLNINNFSGGLTGSKYSGYAGSYSGNSRNLDIHSLPGLLQSSFALVKDSGTSVTDLVLWTVFGSDGSTYFFGDSGKVYKRASNGTWTNPKDLGGRICGAIEYNNYFYAATSNTLYRVAKGAGYDLANLASYKTWTGNEVDTLWHPMKVNPAGNLLIGAGQYLSEIDSSDVWTAQKLDLPTGCRIRCLENLLDDTLIGAFIGTANNISYIYRWDNVSDTFYQPTLLGENQVGAMYNLGNIVYVQSGYRGNLYGYDGMQIVQMVRIPQQGIVNASEVYPDAMDAIQGTIYMGLSGTSTSTHNLGVYTWASHSKDYPKVVNLENVISSGTYANKVIIGSCKAVGDLLFVSWKDTSSGTVYGVDLVSTTTRNTTAVYETTLIGGTKPTKIFNKVILNMEPLAASCAVQVKYNVNNSGTWTVPTDPRAGLISTANTTTVTFPLNVTAESIQFQLTLTSSGSNSPKVNSLLIDYTPKGYV